MKKRMNWILCVVMAAVMAMSTAACGSGKKEEPAETQETEETAEEQETAETEEAAEPEETAEEQAEEPAAEEQAVSEPVLMEVTAVRNAEDTLTLSIPVPYKDLVVVETPEWDEGGVQFYVSEKRSLDEAAKAGADVEGAGFLFSIASVDKDVAQDIMDNDYPGVEVFARDDDGHYYVFGHATDVRAIREEYNDETLKDWSMLNAWAWMTQGTFIRDNGLTTEGLSDQEVTAETLAYGYFRLVAGTEEGTAGSSLKLAQTACDAMRFAATHNLAYRNTDELRSAMMTAYESLTDEERTAFDENFMSVVTLLDSCMADWEGNRAQFDDAGCGDMMDLLTGTQNAWDSWDILKANTLTMGNSDGE